MMKMIVTMVISVYYALYLPLLSSIFSFILVTDIIILKIRRYLIMCEQFKPNEKERRIPWIFFILEICVLLRYYIASSDNYW